MKSGVPWDIKDVRAEARDTAQEAARRAGMSLQEWLDGAILQSAAVMGVHPEDVARQREQTELAALHARLDDITEKLDRVAAAAAPAPNRAGPVHQPRTPDDWGLRGHASQSRASEATPPHAQPLDQMIEEARAAARDVADPKPAQRRPAEPTLDDLIADISARQRNLEATPEPAWAPPPSDPIARTYTPDVAAPPPARAHHARPQAFAPSFAAPPLAAPDPTSPYGETPFAQSPAQPSRPHPAPLPAPDMSGLEAQLRQITEKIESLRGSNETDEQVATLRHELAEIGRALMDAMPRRAVEALEAQVQALAQRTENFRAVGVDPAMLGGLERGLAQVQDTLRRLTPAENLAGFAEAIENLSQKIDLMVSSHDPVALHQLDAAINALRGIVSHVASNEALERLADEMRVMATRIERLEIPAPAVHPDAFASLEYRMSALTEELRARTESAALSPQLDEVIRTLTERMERIQLAPGNNVALSHLEDRIVQLIEKLDVSDTRLGHLAAIERGIADLLVGIEDLKAQGKAHDILRAAPPQPIFPPMPAAPPLAPSPPLADPMPEPAMPPAPPMSSFDILNQTVAPPSPREADSDILGHVVERLTKIDADIRGEAPRPTVTSPAKPVVVNPIPPTEPPKQPAPRPNPEISKTLPIDPSLPPDYPLEPGSGTPHARQIPSAAERIAASEAALGDSRPAAPHPAHSTFIAAARRAARKAMPPEAAGNAPRAEIAPAAEDETAADDSAGKSLGKRARSLLTGLSVLLVVVGGFRVTANYLDSAGTPPAGQPVREAAPVPSRPATIETAATSEPGKPSAPVKIASVAAQSDMLTQSMMTAPESTGSIPQRVEPLAADVQASAEQSPAAPPAGTPVAEPEKLPRALRSAVARGDVAAEYELGVRYLEGRGVALNLEEAARLLEKSAQAGLAPAQFRLGSMYEKGHGVKKDVDAARRLYTFAADKGNAKAMHNLAVLYAEGAGSKPDFKLASHWFRKGAEHGVADSQYNLGILHARGVGVEQNLAESYKWFSLAAAQGDREAVKKRDDVASRLDPASLAAARAAIQTWVARPQPTDAVTVKAPAGGWDQAEANADGKKPRRIAPGKLGTP